MAAKIKTLFDKLGNKLYPKTKISAVYDNNNNTLDTILTAKQNVTDNSLETDSKTIVGAINELKENSGASERLVSTRTAITPVFKNWVSKTWSGLTNFNGSFVWTDGDNIYYSYESNHYVLDKATSTWKTKTWSGLTSFYGYNVWTDGSDIYHSDGSNQYILNKSTSTWNTKTWSGLASFYGRYIWADEDNIYYSTGTAQYVLDKTNSTWTAKTWYGLTKFTGVWTDGDNIYYSSETIHYVLDKATSTWNTKTWFGLTNFNSSSVWTDGDNIYYSYESNHYVLDKTTSTWKTKTWSGLTTSFYGYNVWTDGSNIYYSGGSGGTGSLQYMLTSKYSDNNMVSGQDISNIISKLSEIDANGTAKSAVNPSASEISSFEDGAIWIETT